MFRTYFDVISEVEVSRVSKSCVWTTEWGRRPKTSSYESFFETWEQAHAALVHEANLAVVLAESALSNALSRLDIVKALNKH